jgi:hypothetical protein
MIVNTNISITRESSMHHRCNQFIVTAINERGLS